MVKNIFEADPPIRVALPCILFREGGLLGVCVFESKYLISCSLSPLYSSSSSVWHSLSYVSLTAGNISMTHSDLFILRDFAFSWAKSFLLNAFGLTLIVFRDEDETLSLTRSSPLQKTIKAKVKWLNLGVIMQSNSVLPGWSGFRSRSTLTSRFTDSWN